MIVRENTEDLYAGIEYEAGTPDAEQVIAELNELQTQADRRRLGHLDQADQPRRARERIVRFAFDYARAHGPQARLVRARRRTS